MPAWDCGDSPSGNMEMGIRVLRTHINPGAIVPVCDLSLYTKMGNKDMEIPRNLQTSKPGVHSYKQ